jgi:hypothetical protein
MAVALVIKRFPIISIIIVIIVIITYVAFTVTDCLLMDGNIRFLT